jgi:hypothetical protein
VPNKITVIGSGICDGGTGVGDGVTVCGGNDVSVGTGVFVAVAVPVGVAVGVSVADGDVGTPVGVTGVSAAGTSCACNGLLSKKTGATVMTSKNKIVQIKTTIIGRFRVMGISPCWRQNLDNRDK